MPFPHLCAHRGLSLACPENTLPAFAAAISLGVHEIEFDVKWSRDRVPVICHDPTVDRTTDGAGPVSELDWSRLRELDAGAYLGPQWAGVRLPRLEEVLDLAGGRVTLNVHTFPDVDLVRHVCDLLRERSLTDSAYLALRTEEALAVAREVAPEIPRACLAHQKTPDRMIAAAVEHGCERVQLFRKVTGADIRRAHDEGLVCNLFWSDEPEDAKSYVRKGIDVILTNAAHVLIAGGVGVGTE